MAKMQVPPQIRPVTLKTGQEEQSSYLKGLKEEAEASALRRRAAQEWAAEQQIINPPAPEPPVRITGEISMGKFDLQETQRQARESEAAARKDAEERVEALRMKMDKVTEDLHATKMDAMQKEFNMKIDLLSKAIREGQSSQPNFEDMLTKTEAMAEKLGYSKGTGATEDWNGRIAFARMEAELKRENLRIEQEMEKDRREWQIQLAKLNMEKEDKELARQAEEKRMAMFASLPQQFGAAVAKGMLARGEKPAGQIAASPSPPPQPQQQPTIGVVEANEGESGSFPCNKCGTDVGVGPTAEVTYCASCNKQYNVKRIPWEEYSKQRVHEPFV